MSIKAMAIVWEDDAITSRSELLVMLAIADYANDKGEAWPSVDRLAQRARMTERGVQIAVGKLIKAKRLVVRYNASEYGTNIYRLRAGGAKNIHPENSGTESSDKPSGTAIDLVQKEKNTKKEKAEIVGQIYDAYPRKVGRPKAVAAIMKVLEGKEFEAAFLLERTKLFARAWEGADSSEIKFCPHPATFFNQHRFNDNPSGWGRNGVEAAPKTKHKAYTPEAFYEITGKGLHDNGSDNKGT